MATDEHYSRQVRHWGEARQRQLEQATVLIAGVGGLGGTLSQLLARAGVKKLYLIDDGRVDRPDLNRQTIYTEEDIGRSKIECACAYLEKINSSITVEGIARRIDATFSCPTDVDLIADCLDNYDSRFQLEAQLPPGLNLIHGAIEGDQGQVLTLKTGVSQSLRELFAGTCQPTGDIPVTGAGATTIAALMCHEIYQVIFDCPQLLDRILIVSLTDLHVSFLDV